MDEEHKKKIGFANLGRKPWNAGLNREAQELQSITSADVVKPSEVFPGVKKGVYITAPRAKGLFDGKKLKIRHPKPFELSEDIMLISKQKGEYIALGLVRFSKPVKAGESYSYIVKMVKKIKPRKVRVPQRYELKNELQFLKLEEIPKKEEMKKEEPAVSQKKDLTIEERRYPERADELMGGMKDIVIIDNFVSLIGSYITNKSDPGDIDFLIRSDHTSGEFILRATKVRLAKMLDKIPLNLHFVPDPEGPHDSFVPVYDLVLRRRQPNMVEMSKQEVQLGVVNLWEAYNLMRPEKNELASLEEMKLKIKPEERYLIEKRLGGIPVSVHKSGKTVKVFNTNLQEITQSFSSLLSVIANASSKDFVVDGELVVKGVEDTDTTTFELAMNEGKGIDDSKLVLYVYDILLFDGVNYTYDTLEKRKDVLKNLSFGKNLINTPFVVTQGVDNVLKAVIKASELPDSMGAVIKRSESEYLFRETMEWFEYAV